MKTAQQLIEEGKREELRYLLIILLQEKLPEEANLPTVQQRIAEAAVDRLLQWFRQALKASSIQDALTEASNDCKRKARVARCYESAALLREYRQRPTPPQSHTLV